MPRSPPSAAAGPRAAPASARVVIVDDQTLVREGLRALFATVTQMSVVGTAADVALARQFIAERRPRLVLIDARLRNGDALGLIRHVVGLSFSARAVVLDEVVCPVGADEALRHGASGYFAKADSFGQLVDGLPRIAAGETVVCHRLQPRLIDAGRYWGIDLSSQLAGPLAQLSPRERDVFMQLARSRTVKEAAAALGIRPSTADNHKSRLMKKLGLRKVSQLVYLAVSEGLIDRS